MNRVLRASYVAVAAIIIFFGVTCLHAQSPTPAPSPAQQAADDDSFAPEPAPTLPPGMMGSDTNDPRAKLAPGIYNAGEAAMGLKHLVLIKKPDAFQLGTSNPEDPKVQQTLDRLGMENTGKMPKAMQLVRAQLAF
ncbi:MAG TPA: hypothetical protein VGQ61_12775, partial [Candidatus Angelobacter sp.]|nr:hypothetical protein [Candidatus Angelobacter sp.]